MLQAYFCLNSETLHSGCLLFLFVLLVVILWDILRVVKFCHTPVSLDRFIKQLNLTICFQLSIYVP